MNLTVEYLLVDEYMKALKTIEQELVDYITTHVLPEQEYVEKVGRLSGIRQAKQDFLDILKSCYPDR